MARRLEVIPCSFAAAETYSRRGTDGVETPPMGFSDRYYTTFFPFVKDKIL
jgi:hypothetical protein